jgi:hypothetical protein
MKSRKGFIICVSLLTALIGLAAQTPEWQWAARAGESSFDEGWCIAVDAQCNQYITGFFDGIADFGPYTLTSTGSADIFTAKLDSTGNFLWAVRAGGTGDDLGTSIALDGLGNAYLTGHFQGTATFGPYTLTSVNSADIFVAKLSPSGNFLWALRAGGTGYETGTGIAVDGAGNALLTGFFLGTVSFGSYTMTSAGDYDIFTAKLNPAGNWLWAVSAGGTRRDDSYDIEVDTQGNQYITGIFEDTASFGPYTLDSAGGWDIYVAKLDPAGNFLWAYRAGGTDPDYGRDIAVDGVGNAWLTGGFQDMASFGPYTLNSANEMDIFVAKLDPTGNFLWAVRAGGTFNTGSDVGIDIVVDAEGNTCLTGYFHGTASFGSYTLTSAGNNDIFAAKLDPAGNWLWAVRAGGISFDCGDGIAVDGAGNAYLTGYFSATADFGPYTLTSAGNRDIFTAKLGSVTFIDDAQNPPVNTISLTASPNPFSGRTLFSFHLEKAAAVELAVYDLRGRKLRTLASDSQTPGAHTAWWDGRDAAGRELPSGIYLYRLSDGLQTVSGRIMLLR